MEGKQILASAATPKPWRAPGVKRNAAGTIVPRVETRNPAIFLGMSDDPNMVLIGPIPH